MAAETITHYKNDLGVKQISIGVHHFMCCGASAPLDHPHVYLEMGSDGETICPYCSTLFKFDNKLQADQTEPAGCVYTD